MRKFSFFQLLTLILSRAAIFSLVVCQTNAFASGTTSCENQILKRIEDSPALKALVLHDLSQKHHSEDYEEFELPTRFADWTAMMAIVIGAQEKGRYFDLFKAGIFTASRVDKMLTILRFVLGGTSYNLIKDYTDGVSMGRNFKTKSLRLASVFLLAQFPQLRYGRIPFSFDEKMSDEILTTAEVTEIVKNSTSDQIKEIVDRQSPRINTIKSDILGTLPICEGHTDALLWQGTSMSAERCNQMAQEAGFTCMVWSYSEYLNFSQGTCMGGFKAKPGIDACREILRGE
jgi:hypothetical protein